MFLKEAREAPIPIALQSFLKPESSVLNTLGIDLEALLTADLIFSRLFQVIPAEAFLEPKITGPIHAFNAPAWQSIGAHYLVRGEISFRGEGAWLEGYVFHISSAKIALKKTYHVSKKNYAHLAHQFGDDIVELATGEPGLFSTKIAFVYNPPDRKGREIWLMDFNGRNPRPLVQNSRTNLSPVWTSDGRYIYFTSSSEIHWHLWRTDLQGHSEQITSFSGSALGPSIMPNGKEIVASLSKDGNPELYLMNLEGNINSQLTKYRNIDINPSPSPDGTKMCYSSERLGNLHIFLLDLNDLNAEPKRLTRVGTLNDTCAWNPKNGLILFSGMDTDREFDIFAMNSEGQEMERLTYDAKNNESPTWSPDGRLIAFSSKRGNNKTYQVYIMKANGTQTTQAVDLPGETSHPAWSPRLGYE